MTGSESGDEAKTAAEEIRRVRETARDAEPARAVALPEARGTQSPCAVPPPVDPSAPVSSAPRPDNGPVNALWGLPGATDGRGWRSLLFRCLRPVLTPILDSQRAFNARQVQLDNELLLFLETRLAETHRHYDHVLGAYGQHLRDADERHHLLQSDLVAHVHDLVRRIDFVLAESERGRLSLDTALRDVRARLRQLEERLGR